MKKKSNSVGPLKIEWNGASASADFDAAAVRDDLIALARALGRMAARRDLVVARTNAGATAGVAKDMPAADASKAPQKALH